MAQVITIAGERLFALKAQNNEQLDIDKFIFANVPGQDPNTTIDRNERVPPIEQQVHQQIVQQVGRVNDNVVIYSTVLDSLTGPFDFNWVGLYSSVNQTLIAVSHIPSVSKTITVPGAAGNTLNRNFGIEYSGIADLTGISVAPETWQLDFTARLSGMDELTRQLAADMNGKDWFIGDGFKVEPRSTANTFKVTPGAGYVSGLRVELKQDHILTLQYYPQFVYVDAWFDGDASSQWKPKTAFTVTNGEMDDYIDVNGKPHYVFKLARITAADAVEDFRNINGLKEEIDKHVNNQGKGHDAIYRRKTTVAEIATGVFKIGSRLDVADRDNELFIVAAGGIADGIKILDAGGGNTAVYTTLFDDVSTAIGGVNNASANSKALKIPVGEYSANTFSIDRSLQSISGVSASYYDEVATKLAFVGNGVNFAETNSVNNCVLDRLKLRGTDKNGVGLSKVGNTSVTDSSFTNLRIEEFAVGLSLTYSWSNRFDTMRIHNCTKSFELLSQTNNTVFNNFNATGGTVSSTFTNVEGCIMNAANISNQSGDYAFTMYQSYIIMNAPYFEKITNRLCLLGASSEENPSSLIINSGLLSSDIAIGNSGVALTINGSRQTTDESTQIISANTVPCYWVTLDVTFQYVGEKKASFNPTPLLDVQRDRVKLFPGSSGGSVRYAELYPDYYIMRQTADANGIVLTSSLTIGQQYTLVMMCRKDLISGVLAVKSGDVSIELGDSAVPLSSDDWVIRTFPFVPAATDLKLLYKGDLQIKRIAIYEGVLNTVQATEVIPDIYYNSVAPTLGVWPVGTIVKNSAPAIGQPKGWVCTASPLTFVSEGVL